MPATDMIWATDFSRDPPARSFEGKERLGIRRAIKTTKKIMTERLSFDLITICESRTPAPDQYR
jgi:hypothetical protein